MHRARFLLAFAVWIFISPSLSAQSVTGQISGTITDSADSVIAGAHVELTNDLTRQVRTLTTEASGSFIFADLVPGEYSILVSHPGFKAYAQHPMPGFENFDFSLLKDTRIGKERSRMLELRIEAFNVLHHFNPGNPNTSLTLNCTSGANTNANFGTMTTAVGTARHLARVRRQSSRSLRGHTYGFDRASRVGLAAFSGGFSTGH